MRMPWVDVVPLAETNGALESMLAPVRSLQRAWSAVVSLNREAFHEARRRSLRRHAIETGIIERLYDVEWGVTRALVAQGLTADAVARTGVLDEDVLRLIRTQYEALEFLEDVAREGRELSTSLIRELHVALTRLCCRIRFRRRGRGRGVGGCWFVLVVGGFRSTRRGAG
jgi:hypothetical protein